jgi:PAS domain S-box-containing protein
MEGTRGMDFRSLVESAPDAVVVTDQDGHIRLVNAQTEKLFGYPREELLGRPVEMLIPPRYRDQHPQFREQYHAAPHDRPMGSGMELFGTKKSGDEFPVEISLNVVESAGGRLVSAAVRDVTAQKQAAQLITDANTALKKQAEALEKSNLELQHFAYVVSHDLQTPLRSISGFVQLLQQEYGDRLESRAVEWIRRTVVNTQRMQNLIRDILTYSRIESRAQPFSRVDLNEVYDEVVDVLSDSIADAGALVTREDLPRILGDRPQILQLLQNLVGNALRYRSAAAPRIHVGARDAGEEWVVAVRDNGIGIEPEHFQRIFDAFQRLHTQKTIPGTGIGLAICRRVVTRHGGRIWVESEPGAGSCFHFALPKVEGEGHG